MADSLFLTSVFQSSTMKVHNETDMPDSIADLHCEVLPDLAKLLFDPTLNRLQIKDAIASHQLLMVVLNCYSQCHLAMIRPRPVSEPRFRAGEVDITGFQFSGEFRDVYLKPKVMPDLFGFIAVTELSKPWWVSSTEEFRSNADTLHTSNLGTPAKFELRFESGTFRCRSMRRPRPRRVAR